MPAEQAGRSSMVHIAVLNAWDSNFVIRKISILAMHETHDDHGKSC